MDADVMLLPLNHDEAEKLALYVEGIQKNPRAAEIFEDWSGDMVSTSTGEEVP